MLWLRRELYDDGEFFKVPDAWAAICEESETWKLKTYRTELLEDYKRKAGIVVLGDYVTLSADERLWENARRGCKLSNYILAHEIGHLTLDHHAKGAITKNFQLFSGPNGMSNVPPTVEELEANLAAVFFQCGVALKDRQIDAVQLAHRAFSDVHYVKKAQRIVQLDVFQQELRRPRPKVERVIL
ncbi:hypothetical protein SAMN05444398_101427 [Roseovarius pacificus]|uniref:IrrE N-terminal-like domain-containing protein n=1 Tax=Roseovarius pacificus TaxID=337701 RepID=A0A1M6XH75_9RHOB|nr:hypothetical protein [Roseovarius pacificus]GGO52141.1 hypothetical protein GCM10011315_06980 [Roseovarius pacificus]SHL05370.1 hypothetical protein SAMN05444398_101427 [Roseovarius pacificus]